MAKGILSKSRRVSSAISAETKDINTKGGNMGKISAREIAERTTPADRHRWADTYMRAFDHTIKRRTGIL